jgi:hypothetical protein
MANRPKGVRMMSARQVLIALVIAFGVAATIAAWTTIRQVNIETSSTSSVTQPVSRT